MESIQSNLFPKMSTYDENEENHMENITVYAEGTFSSESDSVIFYDESTDEEYSVVDNDSILEEECERICIEENEFMNTDKTHGRYYIGTSLLMHAKYIMDTTISAKSFLCYPITTVAYYLESNSIFPIGIWRIANVASRVQIMKLCINSTTGEYNVVVKTFWLRIVQRTWKRIFRERQDILRKRTHLTNLQHRQVYGRHAYGLHALPGVYGMLLLQSFCYPSPDLFGESHEVKELIDVAQNLVANIQ